MNKDEQQLFDELQLRCSKTKYRIDFIPQKDGDDGGSRYWEFYSVDHKGYEYGRENFFSLKQLQKEVEEYLNIN
jgi:hypothetical protein